MKWTDIQDIAIALTEAHADVDPTIVRFTDLHRWVMTLPALASSSPYATASPSSKHCFLPRTPGKTLPTTFTTWSTSTKRKSQHGASFSMACAPLPITEKL